MNQASESKSTLAQQIDQSRSEKNGVAMWYLGQVSFLFQFRGLTIVIDPYLSFSVDKLEGFEKDFWVRNYPPPISPDQLHGVDLVLCTHDHLDHVDPETLRAIAAASPSCQFAGPRVSVEEMKRAGIAPNRLTALNEGQAFSFRDVTIEPIASAHEEYEQDAEGFQRFLGYLLKWDGLTFYHAGDTLVTERLSARLLGEAIDIAFLPINGIQEYRKKAGIVGNMNASEAALFASEHNMALVVPTHWDLYTNNGADVADFKVEMEKRGIGARAKIFQPGEKFVCQGGK